MLLSAWHLVGQPVTRRHPLPTMACSHASHHHLHTQLAAQATCYACLILLHDFVREVSLAAAGPANRFPCCKFQL